LPVTPAQVALVKCSGYCELSNRGGFLSQHTTRYRNPAERADHSLDVC